MSLINKIVAFWRFEEDTPGPAIDETGRNNDMSWNTDGQGNPAVLVDPEQATGVIGYGVNLHNSFLYRTITSDFDFSATSFTIGGWIKPGTTLYGGISPIFIAGQMNGNTEIDQEIYVQQVAGLYYAKFKLYASGGSSVTVTSPAITLGDWQYLRCWYDRDNDEIGIQVDCGDSPTETFTGDPRFIADEIFFGRYYTAYPVANHHLDAWGVWKRVLDTGEATDLCAGIEYPFGLCGYLAYGDYEFSNLFHPVDDNLDWLIPSIKAGRRHGGHSLAATLREKRLTVRGAIVKGPMTRTTVVRDDLDTMRAALGGQPQNFYQEPDRYWRNVRVETLRNIYAPTHYCRIADSIEIGFVTSDPFQYAVESSSDTWTGPTNGGTHTISVGGNAPAQPSLEITVGGSGAQTIGFTIENQTRDESFTLTGDVTGGQEITVNTLDQTVTIGTTDEIDLFDGQFFQFTGDADNVLEVTITSGTITSIVTTWRNRWY